MRVLSVQSSEVLDVLFEQGVYPTENEEEPVVDKRSIYCYACPTLTGEDIINCIVEEKVRRMLTLRENDLWEGLVLLEIEIPEVRLQPDTHSEVKSSRTFSELDVSMLVGSYVVMDDVEGTMIVPLYLSEDYTPMAVEAVTLAINSNLYRM